MTDRPNIYAAASKEMQAYLAYSQTVAAFELEPSLMELVKIRASQINGCANCLNIHVSDAKKQGETDQRLALIAAWNDAPVFTPRERAALDWTDHMTQIATKRAPAHVHAALTEEFTAKEQVQLTLAINMINGWNRLAVGFDMFDPKLASWAA
jgi:AhpD family alkylhydroperoxidase